MKTNSTFNPNYHELAGPMEGTRRLNREAKPDRIFDAETGKFEPTPPLAFGGRHRAYSRTGAEPMTRNARGWDASSVNTTNRNPNMKTKNNIITKSIAGTLPGALLAVGLTLGPWTASACAHGGGSSFGGHGGGGGSFGGGAAFGARQPSFAPAMPARGGAAFAQRQPNFASAMRERGNPGFVETQRSFAPAARTPATVHERAVTVRNDVNRRAAFTRIDSRLARLDARLRAGTVVTQDVRLHRDRVARTREFLFGLVNLGTPDWEIDAWTDALWQNEIIPGMPADLVLDYWGDPIATDSIFLEGAPAVVWTYSLRPGRTERITVAGGVVRSVRCL